MSPFPSTPRAHSKQGLSVVCIWHPVFGPSVVCIVCPSTCPGESLHLPLAVSVLLPAAEPAGNAAGRSGGCPVCLVPCVFPHCCCLLRLSPFLPLLVPARRGRAVRSRGAAARGPPGVAGQGRGSRARAAAPCPLAHTVLRASQLSLEPAGRARRALKQWASGAPRCPAPGARLQLVSSPAAPSPTRHPLCA